MITTEQLLELGFKQKKYTEEEWLDEGQILEKHTYCCEAKLYNEDKTIRYINLFTNEHLDKDNNEWFVYDETNETLLEFTDFKQLKAYIELVKNSAIDFEDFKNNAYAF